MAAIAVHRMPRQQPLMTDLTQIVRDLGENAGHGVTADIRDTGVAMALDQAEVCPCLHADAREADARVEAAGQDWRAAHAALDDLLIAGWRHALEEGCRLLLRLSGRPDGDRYLDLLVVMVTELRRETLETVLATYDALLLDAGECQG